jgi:hypothetical protein
MTTTATTKESLPTTSKFPIIPPTPGGAQRSRGTRKQHSKPQDGDPKWKSVV